MKAFLLAAGLGTRLRPITDTIPKCLVEINGTPLLEIWLRKLAAAGIGEVLVNTHHLAEQVRAYVDRRAEPLPHVTLFHEEELLGSAGTVAANRKWLGEDDAFLVVYADNLTDVDLREMIRLHDEKTKPDCPRITQIDTDNESSSPIRVHPCHPWATIALFHSPAPSQCGIAELDLDGRIVGFVEKPEHPVSDLANAGIYVMQREVLDLIPNKPIADFGFDVLPQLVGRMYGYEINGFFVDIGTLERLEFAKRVWRSIHRREHGGAEERKKEGRLPTDHTD